MPARSPLNQTLPPPSFACAVGGRDVPRPHGRAPPSYYPSEMFGDVVSPELFHIENGGGDEEDIEAEEVDAAIALVASRRSED